MRVAVIDVGSNTARLLVAAPSPVGLTAVRQERAYLALGAEILRRGSLTERKLDEVARTARRYARLARKLGAERVEVIVTAPARQAKNGGALVEALVRATGATVRALSAEEEGMLAYRGAVEGLTSLPEILAVCDVGGGSTEVAIGRPPGLPHWNRSVDLGSLRLTAAILKSDPPDRREIRAARAHADGCLAELEPPEAPLAALVVGGSARGLAKLVGPSLGEEALAAALRLSTARRSAKLAKAYGMDDERARVLPAGAIILQALTRRLGVPLELAQGGLREGAALALLEERTLAAV
ncbi:MAG: hypothetical protein H0V40_10235 [Actinobacteria bacterium]|nr:hypothetical protein [Actinomycetota bacterium]